MNPEIVKYVQGHEPVAANALGTCDYISLKNAKGVYITVMHYSGGGDTDLVLTVNEATNVAAGSAQAITTGAEFQIWANTDTSISDALVRQTDAITFTVDTTAGKDQLWVAYISAAKLSAGFDCVALVSANGNAANLVSVLYQLDGARYQQDSMPTAITD